MATTYQVKVAYHFFPKSGAPLQAKISDKQGFVSKQAAWKRVEDARTWKGSYAIAVFRVDDPKQPGVKVYQETRKSTPDVATRMFENSDWAAVPV